MEKSELPKEEEEEVEELSESEFDKLIGSCINDKTRHENGEMVMKNDNFKLKESLFKFNN